jgi:hypothetical protein
VDKRSSLFSASSETKRKKFYNNGPWWLEAKAYSKNGLSVQERNSDERKNFGKSSNFILIFIVTFSITMWQYRFREEAAPLVTYGNLF